MTKYMVLKGLYQEAYKKHYQPGQIVFIGNLSEAQILIEKQVVKEYHGIEAESIYRDDDELDKLPRRL